MERLRFYVYSQDKDFTLEIQNNSSEAVEEYIKLLSIFWEIKDNSIVVAPIVRMDEQIRAKYKNFIEPRKGSNPQLNSLQSSLDKIQNNEYFFTSIKAPSSAEEILFIARLLSCYAYSEDDKKRAECFQELERAEQSAFGEVLQKYKFVVFDSSRKRFIGESDKNKKVCRFCGNGIEDGVSFKKKAHAISEALGNKLLILNEECDDCNDIFGRTIEIDIIRYLDIYRTFFGVKGKKGSPRVEFKNNATIVNIEKEKLPESDLISGNNLVVVTSCNIKHDTENGKFEILLDSGHKIKTVNIYKALCKYALSVINKEELEFLQETIRWIKEGDSNYVELPKVALLINNDLYANNPTIGLYIRKNNDSSHPHVVAELKFKSLIFVFVLPFSSKDNVDFADNKDFKAFWKTFKHYKFFDNWTYYDFSSVESKNISHNINMIQRSDA